MINKVKTLVFLWKLYEYGDVHVMFNALSVLNYDRNSEQQMHWSAKADMQLIRVFVRRI